MNVAIINEMSLSDISENSDIYDQPEIVQVLSPDLIIEEEENGGLAVESVGDDFSMAQPILAPPTIEVLDDDEDEIDKFKREVYKPNPIDESMMDDSETCSICFETWTSSGPHRICCLRCGHLFGKSCVLKWLNSNRKTGKCPQCNARANSKDIRVLFCKRVKAIDTTDRDRAFLDLDAERKLRRNTELELSEVKFKYQLACNDADRLRDELTSVRAVLSASQASTTLSSRPFPSSSTVPSHSESSHCSSSKKQKTIFEGFQLVKSLLLSQSGQCRVVAACDYINLLCVSQPSPNPVFRGFGFRKVHTGELCPLKYIHLHSQPIRDLAFHPDQQDAIIASVSMDRSMKLTSLLVDQVVQTYQCPAPVWSCCWASPSPHYLFAGCGNGQVLLFDIRVTSGPVETISVDSNSSPVTSLQYLAPDLNSDVCQAGGLLVGQLTQVSFLEESSASFQLPPHDANESVALTPCYRSHPLPLEGSLISLSCYSPHRLFLASYRPSQRIPRVRHLFAKILGTRSSVGQPYTFSCNELASLYGGGQMKMMSRAKLFNQESSQQMLAVAGDDDSNGALVWNCNSGTRLQTVSMGLSSSVNLNLPVIDVCSFNHGENLVLLNERQVSIFQWSSSSGVTV